MRKLTYSASAKSIAFATESIAADLASSHRRLLELHKSRIQVVVLGLVLVALLVLLVVVLVALIRWLLSHRKGAGIIGRSETVAGFEVEEHPLRVLEQPLSVSPEEDRSRRITWSGPHNITDEMGYQVAVTNLVAGARSISYYAISEATNSFSKRKVLGEGKFGVVYLALFKSTGKFAAVKMLRSQFGNCKTDFVAEIESIGKLRHPNLVQLEGYCYHGESQRLLLVYEFIQNRNLQAHLFDTSLPTIPWEKRLGIASGLALGVDFLHTKCEQCVIHRDIKPENVMLESSYNPKLGDFGLARLVEHDRSMKSTAQGGTNGYMAPEVCMWGSKATAKSDVFSYGVLLLQIATGKRLSLEDGTPLVSWVWDHHLRGSILDTVDARLEGTGFDPAQARCVLLVGLWCCHFLPDNRPNMEGVIEALNSPASPPKVGEPETGSFYRVYMSFYSASHNLLKIHSYSRSSSGDSSKFCTPPEHSSELGLEGSLLSRASRYATNFAPPPPGSVVGLSPIER